jgi:hypothetical protein
VFSMAGNDVRSNPLFLAQHRRIARNRNMESGVRSGRFVFAMGDRRFGYRSAYPRDYNGLWHKSSPDTRPRTEYLSSCGVARILPRA